MRSKIIVLATQGSGGNDEYRIKTLVGQYEPICFPFQAQNIKAKIKSAWRFYRFVLQERPNLIVMEGTGIFGGFAVLILKLIHRYPYILSSGDAVGPYISQKFYFIGPLFSLYELLLCRFSTGFIGWSPYLVGRALTFGAQKAATAASWAPERTETEEIDIRKRYNIEANATVIGIVGSLDWTESSSYCYGYELVSALKTMEQSNVVALIVGGGNGLKRLEKMAGSKLGKQIILTGRVDRSTIPSYLSAMDLASFPQSVNSVGNFRYSTKLSEYIQSGLPIVTGQLPLAYDLDNGWMWRLKGKAPWDPIYIKELQNFLLNIDHEQIKQKKTNIPSELQIFSKNHQVKNIHNFVSDILEDLANS